MRYCLSAASDCPRMQCRVLIIFLAAWISGCDHSTQSLHSASDRPMRIVSLDYCADQYVLKLADREQILAISPDGVKDFSYLRMKAVGVPSVKPLAEDVLILKPDLVVRSYGGGAGIVSLLERARVPVLQLGFASTIDDEELGSIPALIQHMANGLGQTQRGVELVADFRDRLTALNSVKSGKTALYMTPSGVTSGAGSLVHEMLIAAGLTNFQQSPGWRSLPLERLAYEQPELIAAAFFDTPSNRINNWSAARHPIAKSQLTGPTVVPLQGAWTACGGWFIMDAIEALASGAEQ